MSERLDGLKQRLGQLSDLGHAMSLAHWDQQTMMPPRGGEARAESLATLTRISHEMFVDDETGRLLEGAAAELNGADPDGDDRAAAHARPPAVGQGPARADRSWPPSWRGRPPSGRRPGSSRASSRTFESFAPYLEHNFELARRYVECHAGSDEFECPL